MFKILVVIFLVIAFVPPVRRFLFWLVVGRQLTKEQKRHNQQQARQQKRQGDINVDYVPKDSKGKGYEGGQYVDYEEVKD